MRAEGHRRAAPILAGAVVALVLLTGCRNDADAAPIPTSDPPSSSQAPATIEASSTASAAPEPSPASSAGPATNIPVPVKPALADENSPEGLEAFTAYWLELFSYGYETNDWAPFEAVTDPGCRTCTQTQQVVMDFHASGGWMSGGRFKILDFGTEFRTNTSGSIQSLVRYQQDDLIYYESDGNQSQGEAPEASVNITFSIYEEGAWLLLDFGSPEGT
ncbi:DUF6318 family protein [Arthrobacter pityocampae]|uniref:DUF6318 family protein n=1 Tax=Arthrobacter pityocampae TaxID=547334 RepID=UPI003735D02C